MTTMRSKMLPLAAVLAILCGPVAAEYNENTTIQEGRVNINDSSQRGRYNDNMTWQEGRFNANRSMQVGRDNMNATAQFGGYNHNQTLQSRDFRDPRGQRRGHGRRYRGN